MSIKVELHKDVSWYLQHRCSPAERAAFYEALQRVRAHPLTASEATADPSLSRYMLRFFWFGHNIAVFRYDQGRGTIRILECRRPIDRRRRRVGQGPDDDP